MATTEQIRAAIVAGLQAIPDIGVVHGFERYAADLAKLRQLYTNANRLAGCCVRRVRQQRITRNFGGPRLVVTHWQILAYRALADADGSELAFDAVIDAALTVFDQDETLGGLVIDLSADPGGDGEAEGMQLDQSGPVMFAGVLSHKAAFTLITRHWSD